MAASLKSPNKEYIDNYLQRTPAPKKSQKLRQKKRELKRAVLPSQMPIKQLLPKEVWRSTHVRSQKSEEK